MAVTFTTKANGDVTMLDANAKQVLEMIGKDFGSRGVITAGEAAAAAAKLRAAGSAVRQQGKTADEPDADAKDGDNVPLHVRSQPFIEMLENAAKQNKDILWGV
jgi:hypothetical protein